MTEQADHVSHRENWRQPSAPFPPDSVDDILTAAGRAPSIFNTQPWQFRIGKYTLELHCDQGRKLRVDQAGREMLISCGAALFGVRLAIRQLGYQPQVRLLPDRGQPRLLARVRLGARAPITPVEQQLLDALPHRHTHRGAFSDEPLPPGLLTRLQHDAVAEHAVLALIDRQTAYEQLAIFVTEASHGQRVAPAFRADARQWVRPPGSTERDGVPAAAFSAHPARRQGRLPERDFDLGREIGQLPPDDGGPAAATAVLLTARETRLDWLWAGQAMHRLLADAASQWVFASLHTQALESPAARELIRSRLGLLGAPQLLLQFGVTRTTLATARRHPEDLVLPHHPDKPSESNSSGGR